MSLPLISLMCPAVLGKPISKLIWEITRRQADKMGEGQTPIRNNYNFKKNRQQPSTIIKQPSTTFSRNQIITNYQLLTIIIIQQLSTTVNRQPSSTDNHRQPSPNHEPLITVNNRQAQTVAAENYKRGKDPPVDRSVRGGLRHGG